MARNDSLNTRSGIIVPTLGKRPLLLEECLLSIKNAGQCYVIVVGPKDTDFSSLIQSGFVDEVVEDPQIGLAGAINFGMSKLPAQIEFVNWLGDDDQLYPDSITKCQEVLEEDPSISFVYGSCDYISETGKFIFRNFSGKWASWLIRFGPDLIPQPGSLIRRSAFDKVGGLNEDYQLAFDLDLFIRLCKEGGSKYIRINLGKFRWHSTSLSVRDRRVSTLEASRIRVSHLPKLIRPLAEIWEAPVRWLTLWSGRVIEVRLRGL